MVRQVFVALMIFIGATSVEALQLGDAAPDFKATSTQGELQLDLWRDDHWLVLFSHPASFTPVCTTELAAAERLQPALRKRGVKTLALAVSPVEELSAWLDDIEQSQRVRPSFPLISDSDRAISVAYGMLHPRAVKSTTVRSVFVIDNLGRLRLKLDYPPNVGRNFDELLRAIDALQTTRKYPVMTPADWQPGDSVIISPRLNSDDATKLFPEQKKSGLPYLNYTPLP